MLLFKLLRFLVPLTYLSFNDAGDGGGSPAPAAPPAASPDDGLKAIIAKHNGDLAATVAVLYSDNYREREKNRELRDKLRETEGKVPGDGTVVLTKDDLALLDAYKALGTPDALKELQGKFQQTDGELGALRKDLALRDVADVSGFKLPVLKQLGSALDFEIRDVEKDGKKERAAFVKNGEGQFTALSEYAAANWADFLPALKPPAQQAPTGTPFPNQSPGGTPPTKSIVDEYVKSANEARAALPNPLAK